MNVRHPKNIFDRKSIKNIFYDKMDLYFYDKIFLSWYLTFSSGKHKQKL